MLKEMTQNQLFLPCQSFQYDVSKVSGDINEGDAVQLFIH